MDDLENNADIRMGGDIIDETAQNSSLPKNMQPLYKSAIHKHGSSFTKTTDMMAQKNYLDNNSDIKFAGDSLKALPVKNLNHLPNFDITTNEGQAAKTKFYTQDGNNEKLRRFQALDQNLRSQFGL